MVGKGESRRGIILGQFENKQYGRVDYGYEAKSQPTTNQIDSLKRRLSLEHRVLNKLPESMTESEILEYLLFMETAAEDAGTTAKALLKHFGSLSAVLNADDATLQNTPGINAACLASLKMTRIAASRIDRVDVKENPVLSSWQDMLDYLSSDMAHLKSERVRVLYLDKQGRLIKDYHASDGSGGMATVNRVSILRKALQIEAAGIILVHNHPSGNPEPSQADIQITHRISEAGRAIGVKLHDHLIIGTEGQISLRSRGLI